jgi:hypothetical protein
MKVASAPYSVREVVTRAVEAVRPQVESKGLALELALHPAVDRAVGDARRVEQILLNFLANAVKFTEQGRIRVSVDLVESARELRFRVEDTGCGIAAENLERIFQPFEQLRTGLGRPMRERAWVWPFVGVWPTFWAGASSCTANPVRGVCSPCCCPLNRGETGAHQKRGVRVPAHEQVDMTILPAMQVPHVSARENRHGPGTVPHRPAEIPPDLDPAVLQQRHARVLIRKLEEKCAQLRQANAELQSARDWHGIHWTWRPARPSCPSRSNPTRCSSAFGRCWMPNEPPLHRSGTRSRARAAPPKTGPLPPPAPPTDVGR